MVSLNPMAVALPPPAKPPPDKNLSYTSSYFLSLLQKSSTTKEITQIHTQLLKSHAIQDPQILDKLLSFYCLFDLHAASQLFSSIPQRTSFQWNTLIHGYTLSPTPEKSLLLYINLIKNDPCCLNSHTLPPILKACTKNSALFEGTQIQNHAIKCGFVADVYVLNSLIQMYFKCGRFQEGQKVFDRTSQRNVVSWNCVIGGYAELGMWENVKSLFQAMVGEFLVVPNSITLMRVVTACCRSGDIELGKWVHRYIVENGFNLGLNLGNALMNMYAKFGDMGEARRLFEQMSDRDVVSWTTLVSGYAGVGDVGIARELFNEMPSRNVVSWNAMVAGYVANGCLEEAILLYMELMTLGEEIDKATVVSVLSACARSGDLITGKVVHGHICKVSFNTTLDLLHSILGLYSMCGDMDSAKKLFKKMTVRNEISWTLMMVGYVKFGAKEVALDLFKQMPYKDTASWNALITALAQHNHFNEALDIFEEMQKMKFTPNCFTLVSTLSACARVGALELGKWIHAYIERNDIDMDAQLRSVLMDMYAKCGCIELSLDVFNSMPKKDSLAWSTMIGGLAMHGHSELALEFFRQMEDYGVRPDAITFIGILSACSRGGLVEEGRHYFDLMTKTYRISPTVEHYSCMVDLFGRHGLLREAKEFIDGISISSNGQAIWGALLGACKLHGNVELAKYAATRLLEVDPTNSGAYVLMSNVYAKASKWNEVGNVRSVMKEKGIEKVPGCSSIEVNGVVHEFFVGDASHPKSGDVYMMLDGLESLMATSDAVNM